MNKMLVYTTHLHVTATEDQKKKMETYAKTNLIPISDVVRKAIDEYLKGQELENSEPT
jgi:hypothetical protein